MNDEVLSRTIVMFGKTGDGKSASGNTILGHEHFNSIGRAEPVTSEIDIASCNPTFGNCNLNLTVVDTPGLFDCGNVAMTAVKLMQVVQHKPHVFLLILRQGRFTNDDKNTLDLLRIIFGDIVFRHTILLVTHGSEEDEFKQLLSSPKITQLVKLCGNRVMRIENNSNYRHFDFIQFRRHLNDLDTVFTNPNIDIHKSVIETYCKQNHGGKGAATQLEEMSKELERRQPDWKIDFIDIVLVGAVLGACGVALVKTGAVVVKVGLVQTVGAKAIEAAKAFVSEAVDNMAEKLIDYLFL